MEKLKKGVIFIVFLAMLFLVACSEKSSNNHNNSGDGQVPEKVEVDLQLPERAEPGETVNLVAHISQEGEEVSDADEVVFEIWVSEDKEREHSQMVDVSEQKGGTYQSEYVFENDGVYYVQVHVTARGMHVMPKKKILIGDVEDVEDHDNEEHDDNGDHNH